MTTQSDIPSIENQPNIVIGILRRFGQVAGVLVVQATILFLAAGRLAWVWAWIFLGIYLVSVMTNSVFLMCTSPEMIAERGQPKEIKDWDKVVSGIWSLVQFLVIPLVAGLDVRFGWTKRFGVAWHVAGGVLLAAGLGLFGWAMIANAYFSTAVRIQSDRGQTVCRSGPYRWVRHPGYLGANVQSLGMPFLLGSLWALVPGFIAVAVMTLRTHLEDRTLQVELPGYAEYAKEIRYRLIPGVW